MMNDEHFSYYKDCEITLFFEDGKVKFYWQRFTPGVVEPYTSEIYSADTVEAARAESARLIDWLHGEETST